MLDTLLETLDVVELDAVEVEVCGEETLLEVLDEMLDDVELDCVELEGTALEVEDDCEDETIEDAELLPLVPDDGLMDELEALEETVSEGVAVELVDETTDDRDEEDDDVDVACEILTAPK